MVCGHSWTCPIAAVLGMKPAPPAEAMGRAGVEINGCGYPAPSQVGEDLWAAGMGIPISSCATRVAGMCFAGARDRNQASNTHQNPIINTGTYRGESRCSKASLLCCGISRLSSSMGWVSPFAKAGACPRSQLKYCACGQGWVLLGE